MFYFNNLLSSIVIHRPQHGCCRRLQQGVSVPLPAPPPVCPPVPEPLCLWPVHSVDVVNVGQRMSSLRGPPMICCCVAIMRDSRSVGLDVAVATTTAVSLTIGVRSLSDPLRHDPSSVLFLC